MTREADKVRETYRDDPTVSNEEYGQMVEDADRADQARELKAEEPEPECLDGPDGCSGAVEYRMALSPSGRAFPRCDKHWSERLDEEERITDRVGNWRSDVPPAWFDPTAAGESWDED